MNLTGRLGTADSSLGSIELGNAGSGGLTQSFGDTLVFTDDMVGVITLFRDTLTLTESLTYHATINLTISDTLTLVDDIHNTLTDTITFSDTMTGAIWKLGNFADTVTLTETLLSELVIARTLNESLVLLETLHPVLVRLRSFSDTLTFTDTLSGIGAKVSRDTLTFTETMSGIVSKVFRDVLDLSDTISAQHTTYRTMTDQLVLFESWNYTATLRKALSDTLTFSDSILGISVHPTHDTMTLIDSIVGQASRLFSDSLSLTDTLTFTRRFNVPLVDLVTFSDQMTANKVLHRQLDDVINFIDQLRGLRQRFGTMTDTLTLTDTLLREVHIVPTTDTLTLVDTITFIKKSTRTLNETLGLSDILSTQVTLHRGWSDYLLFDEGFIAKIKYGSVQPGVPPGSINPTPTPPPPTLPPGSPPVDPGYIPSPVWEGVIRVLPQVVMVGKTRTIVLPPPEFNDFSAGQGKIMVQRSMTGRFRVHRKQAAREKLNWRFVIPKFKADEFRDFIVAEIDNDLNVIDWEGNYWNLKILSDSVDFTESRRWAPCGNATDVTVELVGNRYA